MKGIVSFGDGIRPLVIIPGLSVSNIADSESVLHGTFKRFKKDFKIYVIDRPEEVKEGTTNAELADYYYDTMQGLGIQRADVMGISQGGMIAQHIAVRHPHTVRRLVLGVSLARGNAYSDATIGRWLRLAEQNDWNGLNRDIYYNIFTPAFLERHEDAFEKLIASIRPANPERFVRLVKASLSGGPYNELHKISCRTLVIGAANDSVLGIEASKELASILNSELYIFEDYGHGVYDECPDFYAKAYEFLTND